MKLAFLHLYLATASGDPRMVLSLAKESKAQGHEVKVYCSEFDPAFLKELHMGLDIRVVPPRAPLKSVLGASGFLGKIAERIRRSKLYTDSAYRILGAMDNDFDFVFCENDYTYKTGALYKKANRQAKAVWIMNNPPFYHSRKSNFFVDIVSRCAARLEAATAKKFAKWIDWVIVYDKKNKADAEALGFKTKLIGNPLDYDYFYSPVKTIAPKQPTQILAVGALSPLRRFEDVVVATAMLRKDGYDVRSLIICKDYWSDKKYRGKFEEFIKKSGVENYIDARFAGVEEGEMMQALRESHVSVVPQAAKVWIATACEAMAAGMPLVLAKTTSLADVLKDGGNVLLFSPECPDEIAGKIKLLLDDPKFYAQVASAGQRYVKENLSFGEFVKEIVKPI
jgi:glycosyltransferase involved in cell wall biosynthesis